MTDQQCACGDDRYHCRWCGAHKVVPQLARDHEASCVAKPVRKVVS